MKRFMQYSISLLLLLCWGCEEQTSWDIKSGEPYIVVDAIITSEFKIQKVYVYSSSSQLNQPPTPITDATVRLFDGKNYHPFRPLGTAGLYVSDPIATVVNKTYALLVDYKDIKDTAYAQMTFVTPFKNDTVVDSDGLYQFVYGGSDTPAMTEVTYDWAQVPDYCSTYGSCSAATTYYTINSIDVAEEFGSAKQVIRFPTGTTITRKKYSLTDEHEDFIRSLLIETQWRGGLFDVEQGNVPTNFKHGIRGWFGVCMVINDSRKI